MKPARVSQANLFFEHIPGIIRLAEVTNQ